MMIWGALIIWLVYVLAIAGGIVLVSLAVGKWNPGLGGWLFAGMIYVPVFCAAVYFLKEEHRGTNHRDDFNYESVLQDGLRNYYYKHPERFMPKSSDEEVVVVGFTAWFSEYLKKTKANYPEVIQLFRFKKGFLLDRSGEPVRFVMDINRDMWIVADGQRHRILAEKPFEEAQPLPEAHPYITTLGRIDKEKGLIHTLLYKEQTK